MTKEADQELLNAVLEPRKQGALETIAAACSAGADPNAVCPECSTSTGPVHGGRTLLTHSIHECASNAVRTLLECRADPNLTDQNGWTPWMASTLVDGSKRSRIQDALLQFGANKTGDVIVKKLMEWDGRYGVTVGDAAGDSLTIVFSSLPENLDDFYREVLVLCPDAADNERDLLKQLPKSKKLFL